MDLFGRLRTERTPPGAVYPPAIETVVNPHRLGGRRGENKMNGIIERELKEINIRAKAKLGISLSPFERSYYLLFLSTLKEASEFLNREKAVNL